MYCCRCTVRAEMAGESTNTRRRVKLYMLNENRAWDDNGTGHVAVTYSEKPKFMMIDVKSEVDGESRSPSDILHGDILNEIPFFKPHICILNLSLSTQCYASAVGPCVHPLQMRVLSKQMNALSIFPVQMLPLAYPTMC